jgi:hypothetical protein
MAATAMAEEFWPQNVDFSRGLEDPKQQCIYPVGCWDDIYCKEENVFVKEI